MSESRVVELESGLLTLKVIRSEFSLDSLLGFASRENPRRGFLLVSKVLGRHWPVRPQVLERAASILAAGLEPDLPGPVLFVALAETATLLGALVYEAYRLGGREDLAFIQTSRYLVGEVALTSHEPHSHAPAHYLHLPLDPEARRVFLEARSLVLIDDELTTGTTLKNLSGAYRELNPHLLEERWVALTSFLANGQSPVALLQGELEFAPDPNFVPAPAPALPRQERLIKFMDPGRLGYCQPPRPNLEAPAIAGRTLVLGTGEFTYLPFQIARRLEAGGSEVYFQALTRSPIRIGGAIGAKIALRDPYGQGVPHFLYNVRSDSYEQILVWTEPGAVPELPLELRPKVEEINCESLPF